jgi:hypothetical protein
MSEMSATDLKNFNFDVRKLIWPTYMEEYIIGTKKHVLKERCVFEDTKVSGGY